MFAVFLKEEIWGEQVIFGLDNKESKGYVYEIVESATSAIELLVRMLRDKKRVEAKTYENI